MTKANFDIKDVKPGDMIDAYDTRQSSMFSNGTYPLAQRWIVLNNEYDEVRDRGYVDVRVVFTQSHLPMIEAFHFDYEKFNRWQRMMEWRFTHEER